MQPATKDDINDLKSELKRWMLEREIVSIRWFVGTQIAYFVVTWSTALGLVYFLSKHG